MLCSRFHLEAGCKMVVGQHDTSLITQVLGDGAFRSGDQVIAISAHRLMKPVPSESLSTTRSSTVLPLLPRRPRSVSPDASVFSARGTPEDRNATTTML